MEPIYSNSVYKIPQKNNPFVKMEQWKKPWKAKHHVYDGVKIYC